jgi:hypothetical protein
VIVDLLPQAYYLPGFAGINEVLFFYLVDLGISGESRETLKLLEFTDGCER